MEEPTDFQKILEDINKIKKEKNDLEKKIEFYKNKKNEELYNYEELKCTNENYFNTIKKLEKDNEVFNEILKYGDFKNINELKMFIKKYKNHNCETLSIKDSDEYKELKNKYYNMQEKFSRMISIKEHEDKLNEEKEKLNNEYHRRINNLTETLQNESILEHPDYIKLNEELTEIKNKNDSKMYEEEIKKIKDEKEKIIINNNDKINELEETINNLLDKQVKYEEQIVNLKNEFKNRKNSNTKKNDTNNDTNNNIEENLDIEDLKLKYPIIVYSKTDNEIINYAVGEFCNKIKYTYELKNKLNREREKRKDMLDEVVNYIHKNERKLENKGKKQTKYKIKNKINRCHYLYHTYGNKLKSVKFKLKPLCDIGKEKWRLWLNILDEIMNEIPCESLDKEECDDVNKNKEEKNDLCFIQECNNYTNNGEISCKIHLNDDSDEDEKIDITNNKCKYNYCDEEICECILKICDNCGDDFYMKKSYIKEYNECGEC